MKTRLLVAGLPLKIRARLQGRLEDVEVVVARSFDEMSAHLRAESFAAVVVAEAILGQPLLDRLQELTSAFQGLVIFCASGQHSAMELRQMVQRHHVAAILQEPVEPAELIRSVMVQLGLQMRSVSAQTTHSAEVLLDEVWAEHRGLLQERLNHLDRIARKERSQIEATELEEAWRGAHLLTGTMGSLGVPHGTLLAREAESLLQAARDGVPLQVSRLGKIVALLTELVGPHRVGAAPAWADSLVVVVCDDEEFLEHLEVEALLQNWDIVPCEDLTELATVLGDVEARAVIVDVEAQTCRAHPEALEELHHDGVPCVFLEPPALLHKGGPAHLAYLPTPVSPYEVMMAVQRTQMVPSSANPPGILVVDDDRIILEVVSHMLSKIDLHVETLLSPLEFWDTLEQMKPDLVIFDVDLPPLGGIELCRALRADPRYAALPVMFLSSYNDAQTLQRCYEAGGDDYLYKPVSALELTTRVTNRLERTRQIAARPLPAQQPVYPYSSLDQMLLRSLRDEIPACLVRIEVPCSDDPCESQAVLNRVQRLLRRSLRSEDVVKPLGPLELLIGMTGVDRYRAEKRLTSILERHLHGLHFGFAQFPEGGTDLGALIELAKPNR